MPQIFFTNRIAFLGVICLGRYLESRMKNYTIVKVGNDYVVQAEEQSVLKISSRRRAAKLVVEAAVLLDQSPVDEPPPPDAPSIAPDAPEGS